MFPRCGKMKIELSREDVETIIKKYLNMDAVLLNENGSAIIDTTLEKLLNDKKIDLESEILNKGQKLPLHGINFPPIGAYPYMPTIYSQQIKPQLSTTSKIK